MIIKRAIARLLIFVMCIGLIPSTAFAGVGASTETTADGITLTKNATPTSDARTFNVSLGITGSDVNTNSPTDVILVIDTSNSMAENGRIGMTVDAATTFVNSAMTGTNNALRVAVVRLDTVGYARNFSNNAWNIYDSVNGNTSAFYTYDKNAAIQAINACGTAVANAQGMRGGTNTEDALLVAKKVADGRNRSTASSYVIFMTDGVPTFRVPNSGESYDGTLDGRYYTSDRSGSGTSNAEFNEAVAAARNLANGGKNTIYTVGLLTGLSGNDLLCAQKLLNSTNTFTRGTDPKFKTTIYSDAQAPYSSRYAEITTSNASDAADQIADVYSNLAATMNALATGTVTDIIPANFSYVPDSISVPAGATPTITTDPSNGTTTISVTGINASAAGNSITYKVQARDDRYGSAYTNVSATYSYTLVNGDGSIKNLDFYKPIVPLAPVADNDQASGQVNQPITIDALNNDHNVVLTDGSVVGSNNVTVSALTITDISSIKDSHSADASSKATVSLVSGKFNFQATVADTYTFTYCISANVTINGTTTPVKSSPATVTVTVQAPVYYTVSYHDNAPVGKTVSGMPTNPSTTAGSFTLSTATPTIAQDAQNTYTFLGWGTSASATTTVASINVPTNTDVYAIWRTTARTYTVSYHDNAPVGKTVSGMPTNPSTTAGSFTLSTVTPTIAQDAQNIYTFLGWGLTASATTTVASINVPTNTDVYAIWKTTARTYTVSYHDNAPVGKTVSGMPTNPSTPAGSFTLSTATPTIAQDAQNTYTFLGWGTTASATTTVASINVPTNTDVYAIWKTTARQYTVTFVNEDGTVLKQESVAYNGSATAPTATPSKASTESTNFVFDGWDKDFTKIISDLTVTAKYKDEARQYTVTFVNEDGTVLKQESVAYNGSATAPTATPSKASTESTNFVFDGWDKDFTKIISDLTVTAKYKDEARQYTVTFVNEDGTVLKQESVAYNGSATAPTATPSKASTESTNFVFDGWDKDFTKIISDLTVTAKYKDEARQYTVTFVNEDGTVLKQESVAYNGSATAPTATPSKASTESTNFVFDGWDKDFTKIISDLTVTAKYKDEARQYTVTFVNEDGTVLKQESVAYNGSATAPTTTPSKASTESTNFVFDGWDKDFTKIISDLTVTAKYKDEARQYTVTFVNEDGTVLKQESVAYNGSATAPTATPSKASTESTNFVFDGWDKDFTKIISDLTVTAKYKDEARQYTVTFVNEDGTVLKQESVAYNGSATAPTTTPSKASTESTNFVFDGWDKDFTKIISDLTVTAKYKDEARQYTVTFVNEDGTVLKQESVAYNGSATAPTTTPSKASTESTNFVFDGWDKDFTKIISDLTVTAKYKDEARQYTVTFVNEDGTVLKQESVAYNGSATAPTATPSKASTESTNFVFDGWDKDFTKIISDLTVTAKYKDEARQYTVTFVNEDGTVLKQESVAYNGSATAPTTTPSKASTESTNFVFDGWDKDFTKIISDLTVTAKYKDEARQYTVTFVNEDGTVLKQESVAYNGSATAPTATPSKASTESTNFVFDGWDKDFTKIISDLTVTAKYKDEARQYTVTFVNEDGTVLKQESVAYNGSATAPTTTPSKASTESTNFVFDGWDKDFTKIISDLTVTAKYKDEARQYTVTFVNEDGTVLKQESVAYNGSATAPTTTPSKASTESTNFVFDGWDKDFTKIISDLTVTAKYKDEARQYTVTFVNEDGTVLKQESVAYNGSATAPTATPSKASTESTNFVFDGWDKDFTKIISDLTVTAKYKDEARQYTVTFVNEDGTVLKQESVAYNGSATAPTTTPSKASTESTNFVFDGWDKDFTKIISDLTVTAKYKDEARQYTVTFVNEDGTVLKQESVAYNGSATAPTTTPSKASTESTNFVFDGWDKDFTKIISDLTVTAKYKDEARQYTVTFVNEDGTVLKQESVAYNGSATAPTTTPSKASTESTNFVFDGWDKDFTKIISDLTVTAKYKDEARQYTVTFVNEDGTVLKQESVAYNGSATAPTTTPSKASTESTNFVFDGWDKDFTKIISDLTVTAKYKDEARQYTVTFVNEDGTVLKQESVAYNGSATAPTTTPSKASTESTNFVFDGWDKDFTKIISDLTVTAKYKDEARQYTVTFVNEDGTVLKQESVAYNGSATAPTATPSKASTESTNFVFDGWDKDFTKIISDLTVTAKYKDEARQYTVTFVNEDGTVLKQESVAYNGSATAPTTTPSKASTESTNFVFDGWDKDFTKIISDLTVTAQYKDAPRMYTVTSYSEDEIVGTENVVYNKTATAVSPAREGYTLIGWFEPEVQTSYDFSTPVTRNVELFAHWAKNITVTAGSASKTYDGAALTTGGALTAGTLNQGDTIVITTGAIITAVGTTTNAITAVAVYNSDGIDVTANYNITTVAGTLTITSSGGGGGHHNNGGTSTTITDEDVPLAGVPELNKKDHFNYIKGYEDGTVRAQNNITREEVATIFYRLLADTSRDIYFTKDEDFSDIASNRWSLNAIATLANGGIIEGYNDGTFGATKAITRAEFAAIVSRFDTLEETSDTNFSDISGHWAEQYIKSAAKKGWITGYADGTFKPNQKITRAEAMTLINRVLERRINEAGLIKGFKDFPDNKPTDWYYYQVVEATNNHDYAERKSMSDMETWTKIKEDKTWTE